MFWTSSEDVDGFGYNNILNGLRSTDLAITISWMASEVDGFAYNDILPRKMTDLDITIFWSASEVYGFGYNDILNGLRRRPVLLKETSKSRPQRNCQEAYLLQSIRVALLAENTILAKWTRCRTIGRKHDPCKMNKMTHYWPKTRSLQNDQTAFFW